MADAVAAVGTADTITQQLTSNDPAFVTYIAVGTGPSAAGAHQATVTANTFTPTVGNVRCCQTF